MKFQDFIEKFNGKYIDFDGAYGAQCMDLAHYYCVQVLGLTDPRILAAPSARDVYLNFLTITGKDYFDKIDNIPTGIPKEGDIIYWTNAPYGHVAIFVEGDNNSFRSYDQNFPTGSPCHVQNHTYNNVGGWLRFKTPTTNQNLEQCQSQLAQEIKNKNDTWNELQEVKNEFDGTKSQIQHYLGYEQQIATTLNCAVDEAIILGEITKLINNSDQLRDLLKKVPYLEKQVKDLTAEASKEKTKADNCLLTNKELSDANTVSQKSIVELEGQLKAVIQVYEPLFEIFGLIVCRRK